MKALRLAGYGWAAAISLLSLVLCITALLRVDYIYSPVGKLGDAEPLFESKIGLFRSDLARQRFSVLMGLQAPLDEDMYYYDHEPRKVEPRPPRGFCPLWITAGYVAELSIAFVAAASLAYLITTLPQVRTKKRKLHGWKVCAVMSGLHAVAQIASTAIIAHLYRTSGRFPDGSRLSTSFILATISWIVSFLLVVGLITAERLGIARTRKVSISGERRPLLAETSR